MKTAHQRTVEKGRRVVAMARRVFVSWGCLVETAPNVVRWFPKNGRLIPRSTRHDFFEVWDLVVISPTARYFVQVTEVSNMAHRREKILASRFPCLTQDLLMGYRGRGKFRVLRGPFFDADAEEWKVPPPVKRPRRATRETTTAT